MNVRAADSIDESADRVLAITRIFNAPRERVFQAWTQDQQLREWSAPRGFSIPLSEGDIRPGGFWRVCMRSPDGVDFKVGGAYHEIVPGQRIIFSHVWEEDNGQPGHETVATVNFADTSEGGTVMEFSQGVFKSRESRDSHCEGWMECFDRLAEYLRA